MNIRLTLRLRRQLVEALRENARLEGEVHSLDGEIADVRAANTELRAEAQVELEWRLDAATAIEQHGIERARLLGRLKQAVDWAAEVDRVNACIAQQNRHLAADNERLRRELAGLTRPVARVIPLQQRGPEAA
ncbi:hypothetical protein [Streptomyces nigrescens]|uniref:Uncharacterized protein n=1 Tax=Streptomyces nigrescens TaxID=1920 RepID=A0A640TAD8_STRNI|nr:hypothetical protein [Streptomyces libani]WAT94982.1 hypothetical protein STRLI_000655 [Streptomyces libani subsp. libani]GFE20140.1 hypothetical protein Sliba_05930 [Streptomyces libani subsp. libani]GGV85972.1 hypothetical protein GCM10010500_03370 [Streptomyces libani subsp. libani]